MKQIESRKKDQIVISKKAEIKSQKQHLASIRLRKGHKLYKLDGATGKISIVQSTIAKIGAGGSLRSEIEWESNSLYTTALNFKNAKKKLTKLALAFINEKTNSSTV